MTFDQMMEALPRSFVTLLAIASALYVIARMLAETSTTVAKALGPLGRKWVEARDRRIDRATVTRDLEGDLRGHIAETARMNEMLSELRRQYESNLWVSDLQTQIANLSTALRRVREREAVTDAYLVYDYAWHRDHQLGDRDTPHLSFLDFKRQRESLPGAAPVPPTVESASDTDPAHRAADQEG